MIYVQNFLKKKQSLEFIKFIIKIINYKFNDLDPSKHHSNKYTLKHKKHKLVKKLHPILIIKPLIRKQIQKKKTKASLYKVSIQTKK